MASSKTDVFNLALMKVGAARCVSENDAAEGPRAISAMWDAYRDAEMAAHPWTFAKARAALPALSEAPAFGWAAAYQLPSDYLSLIQVGDSFVFYSDQYATFEIEGQTILANEASPLLIRYVRRLENVGLWSPLFVDVFACRLAAELAEPRTQDLNKRSQAWQEYKRAITVARRRNAIEQPPQPLGETSWSFEML